VGEEPPKISLRSLRSLACSLLSLRGHRHTKRLPQTESVQLQCLRDIIIDDFATSARKKKIYFFFHNIFSGRRDSGEQSGNWYWCHVTSEGVGHPIAEF
jgi:hypothetical protein